MGKDFDGLCTILRAAGHVVTAAGIRAPRPRVHDLPPAAQKDVAESYSRLGGVRPPVDLKPGPWDLQVDDVLVELDEELHFNRYRSDTLTAVSYGQLPRFPLDLYREFCSDREPDCLKHGGGQGRWVNDSTERHFGASGPRGDLKGRGSSRWKQRATYDLIKDLTQLDPTHPRVARIAIWDVLPGLAPVSVKDAVHRPNEPRFAEAVRALITERAGRPIG
jgi:hypothetical protein